jgi:hyaluronoglucosaminidase
VSAGAARPGIWPAPWHMETRPDGFALPRTAELVTAARGSADADHAALRTVRSVLAAAGVTATRERADGDGDGDGDGQLTVWLAGGAELLAALGAEDASDLPPGGYVLAAGRAGGRDHIVLDGADGAGTYYAALTLGHLIGERGMPGVVVRDRPAMRYRGSVEGFYGTPWSHADRLAHLAYLGAHRMNTYVYAPKDDPYHRERWREPYPPREVARLGELVGRARERHVELVFALSPGLSMRYSSPADLESLLAKFEAVYALGCRSYAVAFDDIDHATWHDPEDRGVFGDGTGGAGAAQAHVLNAVCAWARTKGDVHPPQMVPTEYADLDDTPYKRALRERLDPEVVVHWTGLGVVPETITVEQAARAREAFGHPILIWDNYPVNDYAAGRLPLAPYTGREPGLSAHVAGVISNPANQAAVSEVALFSFAGFGWHDAGFDPGDAWSAALDELSGGDARTAAALRTFADVTAYDGTLHRTKAPGLAAAVEAFWRRWDAGDHEGAAGDLRARTAALAAAPAVIRAGVAEPRFAEEAGAWLEAAELWAEAMDAALDLLSDGPARAPAHLRRIDALTERAETVRDVRRPHSTTAPKIGDGVIDVFLDAAKAAAGAGAGGAAEGPAGDPAADAHAPHAPPLPEG